MEQVKDAMREANAAASDIDVAFKRITEMLSKISPDKLLLKKTDIRIPINEQSYVVFSAPLGDVLAQFSDMLTAGRPMSEVVAFLLSKCLKEYHIEAGDEVLDSRKFPADKKVDMFVKRVAPPVLSFVIVALMRYIRDVQFGGIDFVSLLSDEEAEEKIEVIEIE